METQNVIRIPVRSFGQNTTLTQGFVLGTTPSGYGVKWSFGPEGLGRTDCWFGWTTPHQPVQIHFRGQTIVFCLESAEASEIEQARTIEFEKQQSTR